MVVTLAFLGAWSMFQSPLRRGGVGDTLSPPGRPPSSFNPLFVGEGSATTRTPHLSLVLRRFQSPLRRGGVGDLKTLSKKLGLSRKMFQSPLRRGGVGDEAEAARHNMRDPVVSIPSSSGRGRRLHGVPDHLHDGAEFQSPLRRGGVGDELALAYGVEFPRKVSIPSSSGRGRRRNGRTGRPSRSPRSEVSIPSSSGRGRRPEDFTEARCTFAVVSIPSSSGRGRRPGYGEWRKCGNTDVSIPSSSGRGRRPPSPTPVAPRPPRSRVSIPSSSGRGRRLQRLRLGLGAVGQFQSPLRRGGVGDWGGAVNSSDSDWFQSPLRRGGVGDDPVRRPGRCLPDVSIPSSSGRGRRPGS